MKPTCIYIGADKSGSTWLHEQFERSARVFVPSPKETFFFDRYYDRGTEWYEAHFAGCTADQLALEVCHDYLYSRLALQRIRSYDSSMRLLVSLRDPVDRIRSAYGYAQKVGLARSTSLELYSKSSPEVTGNSRYAAHLSNVFELFDQESVRVVFFDDLVDRPSVFIGEICDFLGIEPISPVVTKSNAGGIPRFPQLLRLGRAAGRYMRDRGFDRAVGYAKSSSVVERMKAGRVDMSWTVADQRYAEEAVRGEAGRLRELLAAHAESTHGAWPGWLAGEPGRTVSGSTAP